ncbi:hypothetical protein EV356DRAFT_482525 [Viridothelium virens]|uniref:Senescence domain-containing protein n=1 Tax=Viridothelium virens TaxID=1048519 RepID=A0A6A6HDU6_VIRVR|nr:hypothetical protein EV356DRAFT_482525 [Viridothelium virens]
MSAGHNDPRLLYSIAGIKGYHLQNGEKQDLTPSGPQTLSLLMVPTSSPFADLSSTIPQNEIPEEDFYLHLNLPPELDLSLPATTQIYHQPPRSYLIPRWDLGPDSGAFTQIEFPKLGTGPGSATQEDVDTFETILAQCTSFLERARPPTPSKGLQPYDPSKFKPGEAYAPGNSQHSAGQIVLVDEENGSVMGELADAATIVEDPQLKHGSKNPVEIEVSPDGHRISVRPVSEDYLRMAQHPAYRSSSLVQNAASASRLIVTGSSRLSNLLTSSADSFTQKTKPIDKPMEFSPATHARVRKLNNFTQGAAGVSAKTLGQVTKYTQNFAAKMAGHEAKGKGASKDGTPGEGRKPGFMNKSMIAFSTIADGIAYSGKNLLTSSGNAASTVVGHRYGEEAGSLAADLAGGVRNVGLVYIDVTGVSRRAVIKSVAKGMVVGHVKGGGEIVVGGGDGGVVPEQDIKRVTGGVKNDNMGTGQGGSSAAPGGGVIGFGNAAPPSYSSSGLGEPMGTHLQGQQTDEKRWR